MKNIALVLLACCSLSALAEAPPSKEQSLKMQQAMQAQQIQLMATVYDLRKSKLGFEETVAAIRGGAQKRAWKLGEVVDMQAEMSKAGNKATSPMKVIHLCPVGASELVVRASGGKAPPLPCRATVFVGADGKVNVVRLNLHTLAHSMQGDLARVLGAIANEDDALYQGILD